MTWPTRCSVWIFEDQYKSILRSIILYSCNDGSFFFLCNCKNWKHAAFYINKIVKILEQIYYQYHRDITKKFLRLVLNCTQGHGKISLTEKSSLFQNNSTNQKTDRSWKKSTPSCQLYMSITKPYKNSEIAIFIFTSISLCFNIK